MAKAKELKHGTIIRVPLDDFNGNVSLHHAVILSPQEAIIAGEQLVVAGVSTSYKIPLPPGQHLMDYTPGRPHPKTGLSESCAVKGDWLNIIDQADIVEVFDRCNARIVKKRIEFVNANLPPGFSPL